MMVPLPSVEPSRVIGSGQRAAGGGLLAPAGLGRRGGPLLVRSGRLRLLRLPGWLLLLLLLLLPGWLPGWLLVRGGSGGILLAPAGSCWLLLAPAAPAAPAAPGLRVR